jgi:ABC-2 type transport system permease protein
MQTLGFLAVFPLTFASSAFVPVAVLPGWLQAVAAVNPLTPAVEAARRLTLDQPVGGTVAAAVLASLAVGLGAMVVATLGIRRRVAAN